VFSVFQRRVRLALVAAKQKILLPCNKSSERPDRQMLLDLVGRIAVSRPNRVRGDYALHQT